MTAAACLLLGAIAASGCTASFPAQPSTPAPIAEFIIRYPIEGTRLIVNGSFGSLSPFRAYTIDTDRVYADVTSAVAWSSSDPQILRITPGAFLPGLVRLDQPGTVDLIAAYQGRVATLRLLVRGALPPPYLEISSGNSTPRGVLLFAPPPANIASVSTGVSWSSSNERVATVDSVGRVTAVSVGNVEIRATFNGLTDSYWMSVPPRQ